MARFKEKFVYLVLIACLLSESALASVPDSLISRIEGMPIDSIRLKEWIDQSKFYAPKDFDWSLDLALHGLEDAKQNGSQHQIALAYKSVALAYGYHGDPQNARDYYLKAAEIFGLLGERMLVADMYMNSGVEFYYGESYDSSMQYYLKALPVYEDLGDAKSLGRIYNNMATSYRSLSLSDKAIYHFRKSLEYKRQIDDDQGVMNTNLNLANLYRLEDQIDSALIYSKEALEIAILIEDHYTEGLIRLINSLSYIDLNQLELAKTEGLKAERLLEESGDARSLARINASLASLYHKINQCDSARYYAARFEEINPGLKMYREKREISKLMAACAVKNGDFQQGFYFQSEELLYDDSVDVVEQQERLGAITARYEESLRAAELLEKENQLSQAEAEKNRLLALASSSIAGLAIALMVLAFLVQRNRKRRTVNEERIRRQIGEIEKLRERLAVQGEVELRTERPHVSIEEVNSHLINPLTERELEVLKAISEGKSNQQIADELFVSINTVKTHVTKVYEKLDVNNRTQATLKATKLRLVD